jgi:hypothetical protein
MPRRAYTSQAFAWAAAGTITNGSIAVVLLRSLASLLHTPGQYGQRATRNRWPSGINPKAENMRKQHNTRKTGCTAKPWWAPG